LKELKDVSRQKGIKVSGLIRMVVKEWLREQRKSSSR